MFNTPSSHRVHHARNPEYLDANYGGVLILFDRLFGSYIAERADLSCDYGLISHPQSSHNILVINFEPWIGLFKDLRSARSLREVVDVSVRPAGLAAGRRRPDDGRDPPARRPGSGRLRPGGPFHSGMT